MKKTLTASKLLSIVTILFFVSCSDSEVAPKEEPVITTLDGKYVGGWTSTTQTTSFTNFPISTDLTINTDNTRLSGFFYAANNFVSCCNSGDYDGRMSLTLDGDSITSFSLSVIIPDCFGQFSGKGVIGPSGNLVIDITGSDCDGDHIGQLVFRK